MFLYQKLEMVCVSSVLMKERSLIEFFRSAVAWEIGGSFRRKRVRDRAHSRAYRKERCDRMEDSLDAKRLVKVDTF
jgi:hypothetical protein